MYSLTRNTFLFGGDYSPEQWNEEILDRDIELMKELGVNCVTINVHSWFMNEPKEGVYDFTFLDRVVDSLKKAGIMINLATGTTSAPSWLYQKDHGTMKTNLSGTKMKHGVRERFCPTSINYIDAVRKMVSALAEHYKDEDSIILWHLNNELSGFCFCENCEKEFRIWLKNKYQSIDKLNDAWCTAIWGRYYSSFDDINVPTEASELYLNVNNMGYNLHSLPTEAIEYARFMSEKHMELFKIESECIKNYIPDAKTTNNYQFRDQFNYHTIAKPLDVISFDTYPERNDPIYTYDFNLDLVRNLKNQNEPFLIMEMTPNHASWSYWCSTKRPGEIGRIAMNNIAKGANSALFFQIRRTPSGFEKFHGAMIGHCGHIDTRIGRELKALSADLRKLPSDILETVPNPSVAVIHDWDEKLGVEIPCSVRKDIRYPEEVQHWYRYFDEHNIPTDVISLDQDFARYKLVVAPMVAMIRKEYADKLVDYVKNGGYLILTYYSGYTNECDYMYLGGQPGPFREAAGLWVEEIDGIKPGSFNSIKFEDGFECTVDFMCDVIRPETAKTIAAYQEDYYKNTPCVLENSFGGGTCLYVGAKPSNEGVDHILEKVVKKLNIESVLKTEGNVRASKRGKYLFVINHGETETNVDLGKKMWNILEKKEENSCVLSGNGYAIYLDD